MPYLIHKDKGQISLLPGDFFPKTLTNFSKLKTVYDTEFTSTFKLTVDSIQLYTPKLNKEYAVVWTGDELTADFNPWFAPFAVFGYDVQPLTADDLSDLYTDLLEVYNPLVDGLESKKVRITFETAVATGHFDEFLSKWRLKPEYLQCKPVKGSRGEFEPLINIPKLVLDYEAFFADVDLFKSVGQNWQYILLESALEARRVIKSNDRGLISSHPPVYIDGVMYEVQIKLRDAMSRFPPAKRSLDSQCDILQTQYRKLNVETVELASKLGHDSPNEIKMNMSLFSEMEPILFAEYGAQDCFATDSLSERQEEYLNTIRADFQLDPLEVRDTTGSNVSGFLNDLILKHFGATEGEAKATVTGQRKLGNADKLQSVKLNDFGVQSFQTVGGLLYSRVARYPVLKGYFGDLDESSCYATKLSNMDIYLGQPITSTFKARKYKPSLKEALQVISEQKCPRDAWLIRVSGKLQNAENTLILSDLDFTPKQIKFKTVWDKKPYQASIEQFNAYKTSDGEASSTLLRKEIKFGLVNADILDCLKLLPERWLEEYLDLKVDTLVFIPKDLICDTLEDFNRVRASYDIDEYEEKLDPKTGLKQLAAIRSKANVCLRFPIGKYYQQLKVKRAEYKKAKNPIQEIYKLFLNSGYGALACRHLPVNNLLAANQITASARATSWMMINALNGLQVITDGSTFSWEHIPLGQKFKDLLEVNPTYLVDFDPSVKSNLPFEKFNQQWINKNFKQHFYDFYNVDHNHIPANLYDFELKSEKFADSTGEQKEIDFFTEFHSTGSGNYSKGLNDSHILIDGSEYSFINQHKNVKARSFRGDNPDLMSWYIDSLENGYKTPRIDTENKIIKFGEAVKMAVKYLKEVDRLAFPCGFSQTKYKLMKLITRSQFLFKTEKQLKNFERTNQLGKLDGLSKSLLTKTFWKSITLEDLRPYGVTELRSDCDYWRYNKDHPIGLGFELLTLNNSHKGSIESVRNFITDKIQDGVENFNATLNLDRNLLLAAKFKNQFAALIVLRANAEMSLQDILINSAKEPTVTVVSRENVKTLAELRPDFWSNE
jgi:hypothetical protein